MKRIKMIIEYDGSRYHGFQIQNNAHTIQAELENSIFKLIGERVSIIGAGRTDTGVHALGQVIAFDTCSSIPADRWQFALNSILPPDICILDSQEAVSTFHPRFDAIKKKYTYLIYRGKKGRIFLRNYALCNSDILDIAAMGDACRFLEGTHNFRSFCASGSSVKSFERSISNCRLFQDGPFLKMEIEANGFLYNMVRIIIGTLLEIGQKKYPADYIKYIIEGQNRALAGATALPQGLYLWEVIYHEDSF